MELEAAHSRAIERAQEGAARAAAARGHVVVDGRISGDRGADERQAPVVFDVDAADHADADFGSVQIDAIGSEQRRDSRTALPRWVERHVDAPLLLRGGGGFERQHDDRNDDDASPHKRFS